MSAAEEVLALALSRPMTLGSGRLICIDGPSGSGKSKLGRAITRLGAATVVHTDDLCPGWDGLPLLTPLLSGLLAPLASDLPGSYPRYDWILGRTAETVTVPPSPLLIVEGVGAGARSWADLTTVLVWTDAERALRQERAFARDGDYYREYWDAWAAAEAVHFATERPQERADIMLMS